MTDAYRQGSGDVRPMTAPAVRLIAIYDTMLINTRLRLATDWGGVVWHDIDILQCAIGGVGEGVVEAMNEYGTNEKKGTMHHYYY